MCTVSATATTLDDPAALAESADRILADALSLIRAVKLDAAFRLDGPELDRLTRAMAKVKGVQAMVALMGQALAPKPVPEPDAFREIDHDDAFAEATSGVAFR